MEEIKKMLQTIQGELHNQKQDMKKMEENIKYSINKNIDEKFKHIEERTNRIEQKVEQQQKAIDFFDRQLRKRNIIFFGVEEKERNYDELLKIILEIINEIMGIPCQKWEIETTIRMGKKTGKIRPVIVTISTTGRKLELLRNKKKLMNTAIYIKEDYPPHILQKRKELQGTLEKERAAGKKVTLRYDKIVTIGAHSSSSSYQETAQSNKRYMSESSEAAAHSKTPLNEEGSKHLPKRNKPQNITNYLQPSKLFSKNKNLSPVVSYDVEENETRKN